MVEVDGKQYRIQRYCPHAGQDLLETGELLPGGVIRCLGHHYEFDRHRTMFDGTSKCVANRVDPTDRIPLRPGRATGTTMTTSSTSTPTNTPVLTPP